jgi:hypothetical protein
VPPADRAVAVPGDCESLGAAAGSRRLTSALRLLRYSVAEGVRDGLMLFRQRSLGVIAGSAGTTAFDLAVLGVRFRAFGGSSPIGVHVFG